MKRHLKDGAFRGWELAQATARVCAMNLMLHGIGSEKSVPVRVADALAADPGERFDVVLANPPFGKKSSTMIVGEDGKTFTEKDIVEREDLTEFVSLYHPANRHQRTATWSAENPDGRWRVYGADELLARENEVPAEANLGVAEVKAHSAGRSHKASLDVFWLKDESLADSDNLPPPEVIAQEIVDDLEAALEQFRLIAADVGAGGGGG